VANTPKIKGRNRSVLRIAKSSDLSKVDIRTAKTSIGSGLAQSTLPRQSRLGIGYRCGQIAKTSVSIPFLTSGPLEQTWQNDIIHQFTIKCIGAPEIFPANSLRRLFGHDMLQRCEVSRSRQHSVTSGRTQTLNLRLADGPFRISS